MHWAAPIAVSLVVRPHRGPRSEGSLCRRRGFAAEIVLSRRPSSAPKDSSGSASARESLAVVFVARPGRRRAGLGTAARRRDRGEAVCRRPKGEARASASAGRKSPYPAVERYGQPKLDGRGTDPRAACNSYVACCVSVYTQYA